MHAPGVVGSNAKPGVGRSMTGGMFRSVGTKTSQNTRIALLEWSRSGLRQLVGRDLTRSLGTERLGARRWVDDGLRLWRHGCGRRGCNGFGRWFFVDVRLVGTPFYSIGGGLNGFVDFAWLGIRFVVGIVVELVVVELVIAGLVVVDLFVVGLGRIRQHVVRAIEQAADGVGELRAKTGEPARAAGQPTAEFTQRRC
jgi:hypothetical protein